MKSWCRYCGGERETGPDGVGSWCKACHDALDAGCDVRHVGYPGGPQ